MPLTATKPLLFSPIVRYQAVALNAFLPIFLILLSFWKVITRRLSFDINKLPAIISIPSGIVTCAVSLPPRNEYKIFPIVTSVDCPDNQSVSARADGPISSRLYSPLPTVVSSITKSERTEHLLKQLSPISVTVLGMTIDLRFVKFLNAYGFIVVMPLGK